MIIDNPYISGSLSVQNDVTASNIQILVTASAAYFTGSFVGDGTQLTGVTSYTDADTLEYINSLGVISGSEQISSDISGSFLLNTTDTLTGDLTVTGKITAHEFHTEFVSASILFKSGSTKFGDSSDDVHSFTGSISVDGGITGSVNSTGDFLPSSTNTYDLGSPEKQWRDLYLSSASLYVDGVKVLSSDANTLTFTTDTGQSIKFLESGGDDITLQTDTGNIELKGTVEILSGKKIIDSAGTIIQFGDSLGVSGSIEVSGTVDGIDLQSFSSSLEQRISNISTDFADITNKPILISSSAQIASDISGSFTDLSSSLEGRVAAQENFSSSLSTTSLILSGSFSGSFYGDGSNLSGVTSYTDADTLEFINSRGVMSGSIAELTAVTASFLNTGSVTIPHSFNSKNVSVQVYDSNDIYIIPQEIALLSDSAVKITFGGLTSGFAVVSKGGHIISGSVPVPQLSTVASSFTSATSHTVTHNFGTKEVIVSVYENDSLIFPSSITTPTINTVTITLPEAISGRVVVVKAGHIVSGSIEFSNILSKPNLISSSAQIASDISGSFTELSSSLEQRVSANEISVSSLNSVSSSYLLNTTDTLTGDLTVTGQVIAQTLNVQQVTSSIVYSSGSNVFGNDVSNTQQFTGSLLASGSSHYFLGDVGIGTMSPDTPLHILRYAGSSGTLTLEGNDTVVGMPSITFLNNNGGGTGYVSLNTSNQININGSAYFSPSGASTFLGPTLTLGNATAATNVKLVLNGVANKAAGIEFQQNGTPQWYIGNGIASEDNNFELYNSNGTMAMKIIKSTNAINFQGAATFGSSMTAGSGINAGDSKFFNSVQLTDSLGGTCQGFLWTDAANTLKLGTGTVAGGNVKMTITSAGNVGIGYTSPTYPLQVLNNIGLRANSQNFQAIKGTGWGYSTSSYRVVMLGDSNTANFTTVSIGYDPSENANGAFSGDGREVLFRRGVQFVTPNAANNSFNLYNLVLLDGKVGIGTTTPITKLSLGGYNGARLAYVNGTGNTFDAGGITIPSSNTSNAGIGGGIDLTNNTYSVDSYSPIISFSSLSLSAAYNNAYAGIWGVFRGPGGDSNWNVGDLVFGTASSYGITEKMRITSDSINVTSAGFAINRTSSGEAYIFFKKDGVNRGAIYGVTGGGLRVFDESDNQVLTITGNKLGVGTPTPSQKLTVHNGYIRQFNNGSSTQTATLVSSINSNSSGNFYINVNTEFNLGSSGYILVEVTTTVYAGAGAGGAIHKWVAGGYAGHTLNSNYHKHEVIANNVYSIVVDPYNPTWDVYGVTIQNNSSQGAGILMEIRVTSTF